MVCSISCYISAVFIIGMIYFYNRTSNNIIVQNYKNKLPTELKLLYDKLVKERTVISYNGYIMGFILSMGIIYYNVQLRKNKMGDSSLICIVMSTCFLVNYITDPELVKAWLGMYREMQYSYHMGMVLGIIAVGIIAFAFRG
jgi:hypothetical protein